MANRLQVLNLNDFTGGLNLRADAFQLQANESPDMLNVEIDPRGGFQSRRGWVNFNDTPVVVLAANLLETEDGNFIDTVEGFQIVFPERPTPAEGDPVWNPRNLYVHAASSGAETVLLVNEGVLYASNGFDFAAVDDGGSPATQLVAAASPHGADFAAWGDALYTALGYTQQSVKWVSGSSATPLTVSGAGAWQNDYLVPVGGHMPKAELCASHLGYVFVAGTNEDGQNYPNRIRWSHPNSPENWAELDYIDILTGGSRITAIVPYSDHLLIFKTDSVWGLFGYSADTWQVVNVTNAVGAVARTAVAESESAVFFFAYPHGVMRYSQQGVFEVSQALRPALESGEVDLSRTESVFLGWLNRRLWVGVPYTNGRGYAFVFDPTLGAGDGAWVRHACPCGAGLGPFAQGGHDGNDELYLACHQMLPYVMKVDQPGLDVDLIGDRQSLFPSYFVTKWENAGWPTLKKSWRRPDFVVKDRDSAYQMLVSVYHDYNEADPKRAFVVDAGAKQGNFWGEVVWGLFKWGGAARGSRIERGRGLGLGRAVQLRIDGQPGRAWGVDSIVLKYIPRRVR